MEYHVTNHPPSFTWNNNRAIIESLHPFLAGAGTRPHPRNPFWVGGRDAWSFDTAGRLTSEYTGAWALIGSFHGPYTLIWFSREYFQRVTNPRSIAAWLEDQARGTLPSSGERAATGEAVVQVNLALWFVTTNGRCDTDEFRLVGIEELEAE